MGMVRRTPRVYFSIPRAQIIFSLASLLVHKIRQLHPLLRGVDQMEIFIFIIHDNLSRGIKSVPLQRGNPLFGYRAGFNRLPVLK